MRSRHLAALSSLSLVAIAAALSLSGCAAEAGSAPAEAERDEQDATASRITELLLPRTELESSTTRTAKVATIKLRGGAEETLGRCHQYYGPYDAEARESKDFLVCRDDKREIVLDAAYARPARWARVRAKTGRDQFFKCTVAASQQLNPELYGDVVVERCLPEASADAGRAALAFIDAEPVLPEGLSTALTFGGLRQQDVSQNVASAARPASVMILGSESETTTREYFSKNLRVVRFPDAPASVDAGHSAVFIGDAYCQRLEPRIAAW